MQKELNKFTALGSKIVVVIRNNAKNVNDFWKKNKLQYIGIPDKDKKLGKLYRQQWKLIKLGLMPAMFVINQQGKISYSYYSNNMKDIPENKTIFEVLKNLKSKATNTAVTIE